MQLEDFLKNAEYFSLGHLPTEGFHPLTQDLSTWVRDDLDRAIDTIQEIDLSALQVVRDSLPLIRMLSIEIQNTFNSGSRVFLSGCGATGRLALALETTFRSIHRGSPLQNKVQALMAGGDFALVKSVENFEDFPEYGERHLLDLGFKEGDLLIAITEGGETPYVIGTAEGALKHSSRNPWFVYCNPRDILVSSVKRSREIIENPRVNSLCLPVGPMALSGSTRLQAATVQMLAVGMALTQNFFLVDTFIEEYQKLNLSKFLAPVVEWESSAYLKDSVVLYQTSTYPIAVLTDTTERSPTFSLTPFEKSNDHQGPFSLCYLSIPDAHTARESWQRILNRDPIGLEWPEFNGKLGLESIFEFDFGRDATQARERRVAPKSQAVIRIDGHHRTGEIELKTNDLDQRLSTPLILDPLGEQILVKLILNTLSLMVMGRLNRFEGNVMTWVRASNGKLIDRTLRYLEKLIENRGFKPVPKPELIRRIFDAQSNVSPNEPVILRILSDLEQEKSAE